MVTWGIDLGGVLSCFIKYPLRCKEVIERLEYQRVINPDHKGLALSDTEAVVFREMLGYFEYDYRIALLVALDCNGIVRQTKVRLAVLLKNGTTDFIGIKSTATASSNIPSQVMEKSRGISHSLRNEGLLWLVLGLLNLNSTTTGTIRELLSIHRSNLCHITSCVSDIMCQLWTSGIRFDHEEEWEWDFRSLWEFDSLSTDEENQLRSHLLRCFMFQLTMVQRQSGCRERLPEHCSSFTLAATSTACSLEVPKSQSLVSLFDTACLLQEGRGVAYVIAHDIYLSLGRKLTCRFWASVPESLVAEWPFQWSEGKSLFPALNTGIYRT